MRLKLKMNFMMFLLRIRDLLLLKMHIPFYQAEINFISILFRKQLEGICDLSLHFYNLTTCKSAQYQGSVKGR